MINDEELLDMSMRNAYTLLMGVETMEEIMNKSLKIIALPWDPRNDVDEDEEIQNVMDYFVSIEEYEKCADLRDLLKDNK
jgi:hypothetical protein